jgi:hypothetical protein
LRPWRQYKFNTFLTVFAKAVIFIKKRIKEAF